jgi:hypothetical protein
MRASHDQLSKTPPPQKPIVWGRRYGDPTRLCLEADKQLPRQAGKAGRLCTCVRLFVSLLAIEAFVGIPSSLSIEERTSESSTRGRRRSFFHLKVPGGTAILLFAIWSEIEAPRRTMPVTHPRQDSGTRPEVATCEPNSTIFVTPLQKSCNWVDRASVSVRLKVESRALCRWWLPKIDQLEWGLCKCLCDSYSNIAG